MTEQELRQRVTAQGRAWLGLSEPSSYLPILNCYNDYARRHGLYVMKALEPWCAMYVSAVFIAAGLPQIIPVGVNCAAMVTEAQRRGLWIEDDDYLPAPGDIIQYDWEDDGSGDNRGEPDHIGLVASVSGSRIGVLEGNCADAVRSLSRARGERSIRGYIVPDYRSAAEPGGLVLPMLRWGSRGQTVQAMQGVLIALGYDCGPAGADGDFGGGTETALRRFQRERGLDSDGICGPLSWYALLIG